MNRKLLFVTILLFLLVPATGIFAGTKRNPSKDTTCAVDGTCANGYGVQVGSSGGPGGGCKVKRVGYIGWDLAGETRTWQSATLDLTAYYIDGVAPYTFELHPANSNDWSEDVATDPGYIVGTVLATSNDDPSAGPVHFMSNELGNHFTSLKGGQATIAVVMTAGCGSIDALVAFEDREGTGGSAPTSGNEADLIFWTGANATAVSLSDFSADNAQPMSWPLYAGLAALAVLVIGAAGYGYSRKA